MQSFSSHSLSGPAKLSRQRLAFALSLLSAAALLPGIARAQIWDFPQPHPIGKHVDVDTQIQLRPVTGIYDAPPPPAVVTVPAGARVTFSLPFPDAELRRVTWYKDGTALAVSDSTLVLDGASPANCGVYTAIADRNAKDLTLFGNLVEKLRLQVGTAVPRTLAALSTRATLSASNPTLIGGFVLDAGSAGSRTERAVLIRAVGPSLADLGLEHPLAAPRVAVYDANGRKIEWPDVYIPEMNPYALAQSAAARVGAFPLRDNAGDFAILEFLPPGAYTAHVSSADETDGDTLLEVYEVSDEVLAEIAPDYFGPRQPLPSEPKG